jgi:phosphatidate phosphatase PAH1
MRYVVDIDGTICYPGNGDQRYTHATPRWDRIHTINKLYDEGHQIIYLTARGMGRHSNSRILSYKEFYDSTYDQLKSWQCKFHELHLGKPSGDYYIDDKGINADDFFRD